MTRLVVVVEVLVSNLMGLERVVSGVVCGTGVGTVRIDSRLGLRGRFICRL